MVAVADEYEDSLSLFTSHLLSHPCTTFGDGEGDHHLRLLQAALSAGPDVPALLHTRSAARRLLQDRAKEAFAAAQAQTPPLDHARILAVADFFARAFALVADVQVRVRSRPPIALARVLIGPIAAASVHSNNIWCLSTHSLLILNSLYSCIYTHRAALP